MVPTSIEAVPAAAVRPLRSEVLRPGQPPTSLVYPGDDHPQALHVGAFADGVLVGIATVYPEPMPLRPMADVDSDRAFRLRGMATRPDWQGKNLGRRVLTRCIEHARDHDADVLWCNARVVALGFYERLGFETLGDEFDIEGIGPHYVMWRSVR